MDHVLSPRKNLELVWRLQAGGISNVVAGATLETFLFLYFPTLKDQKESERGNHGLIFLCLLASPSWL